MLSLLGQLGAVVNEKFDAVRFQRELTDLGFEELTAHQVSAAGARLVYSWRARGVSSADARRGPPAGAFRGVRDDARRAYDPVRRGVSLTPVLPS